MIRRIIRKNKKELIQDLWKADRTFHNILLASESVEDARSLLDEHLDSLEESYFDVTKKKEKKVHVFEKDNAHPQ
jgi:hypothetical protein